VSFSGKFGMNVAAVPRHKINAEKKGIKYLRYSGIFAPPMRTNDNCIRGQVMSHSIGRAMSSENSPSGTNKLSTSVSWKKLKKAEKKPTYVFKKQQTVSLFSKAAR